ncbi:MAG: type IX secretion system membrane protein PorP/SprF [Cytophagales bacterium]|nr:type IX secretion system membrane protein PorP/SprF [Cytophagales bacterium]
MNRFIIYIGVVSFFLLKSVVVLAQQDPQFSHFMFTPVYHNPAYAGVEEQTKATLLHRSQWLGYDGIDEGGAPSTQLLSATHPFRGGEEDQQVISGVGLFLVNDRLGPLQNFNFKASYAHHFELRKIGKYDAKLSVGARLGFYHQRVNSSLLRPSQENDAVIQELQANGNSQMRPDFGLGVWFDTDKYYAGISMSHLIKSTFDFSTDVVSSRLTRHFYVTGGYTFDFSNTFKVTPMGLLKTDFAETSFDLGALAFLADEKYWAGITVRQSVTDQTAPESGKQLIVDDVVMMVGMSLLTRAKSSGVIRPLRIGYSFDLVTTGVAAKNPTSHEIFVSYIFPVKVKEKKARTNTPRYKYDSE